MKTDSNWSTRARVLLSFLTRQSKCCPYCESNDTIRIGKNAILSHVRECRRCSLMFRWPKQDDRFNLKFYQTRYAKVHHSPVTDLPTDKELAAYKASVFRESPRDFHNYIDLMKDLGVQTVLDYGCSWGYAVYQFKESGLNAHGLEISKPRARYGKEKLGVEIFEDPKSLITSGMKFDCIFSSHVLEHLPSPRIALDLFKAVTKPTSVLILEVPNCGGLNAEALGLNWGPFSSALHPLSFTSSFFVNSLSPFKGNFHCTSKPFDPKEVANRFRENPSDKCPPGDELVILKAIY
jgi:2-polyprenyl-3-methyl-5-hydroxy-6-metoxy-1,4-benzoquinol methylase